MGIQNYSERVLLVTLPEQPRQGDELEEVAIILSEQVDRDVVVDFAGVRMLTSETLCNLVTLDRLLRKFGHLLVLCNVSAEIKHIFVRTGLAAIFEFAEDESAALDCIRNSAGLPAQ